MPRENQGADTTARVGSCLCCCACSPATVAVRCCSVVVKRRLHTLSLTQSHALLMMSNTTLPGSDGASNERWRGVDFGGGVLGVYAARPTPGPQPHSSNAVADIRGCAHIHGVAVLANALFQNPLQCPVQCKFKQMPCHTDTVCCAMPTNCHFVFLAFLALALRYGRWKRVGGSMWMLLLRMNMSRSCTGKGCRSPRSVLPTRSAVVYMCVCVHVRFKLAGVPRYRLCDL